METRLKNRFKNRFMMKPIERNGEVIAEYKHTFPASWFKWHVNFTLSVYEENRNNQNFKENIFKTCNPN